MHRPFAANNVSRRVRVAGTRNKAQDLCRKNDFAIESIATRSACRTYIAAPRYIWPICTACLSILDTYSPWFCRYAVFINQSSTVHSWMMMDCTQHVGLTAETAYGGGIQSMRTDHCSLSPGLPQSTAMVNNEQQRNSRTRETVLASADRGTEFSPHLW